jgi:glycine cleavage system H lipoate-binding protein
MHGNEFLSGYSAKLVEYGLAVTYLVLFIGFWRYVQGGKAEERTREVAEPKPEVATGWFTVPEGVALHPGHSWARLEDDGSVAVGLDDLGHRLVGDMDRIQIPGVGDRVEQGAPAVTLSAGGRSVKVVSPVDGEVIAYNAEPDAHLDPYGRGWLFRVQPDAWKRSRAQLLEGAAAREWLEDQGRRLSARLSPEPQPVLQDGGAPLHGIAREIDPEHWDDVAREFFRTQENQGKP